MTSLWSHLAAVVLFGLLWSCSSCGLAEQTESPPAPPLSTRLDSPLIAHAEKLTKTTPGTNHLSLIEIGHDALLSRIHLIRSAQRSIAIQTIIWADDETGRLFLYELLQCARRGVKVQLLIDHLGSEAHIESLAALSYAHPNLQIKLFNPVKGFLGQQKADMSTLDKLYAAAFNFKSMNQRMHNKTFIVDNLVGITGGRNYQNAYYDMAFEMNYKDRDVLVIGPVVQEMRESFDCYWQYEHSLNITALADVEMEAPQRISQSDVLRESFRLGTVFDELIVETGQPELITDRFIETLFAVEQAYFIADDPHKLERSLLRDEGHSVITMELAKMVADAERSVYIQTPYLILTSQGITLFRKLRDQNPEIDVRISTNSLAATDSWYVYALSYKQKKTYLGALDFKIFEFKPRPEDLTTYVPGYPKLAERAVLQHEIKQASEDEASKPASRGKSSHRVGRGFDNGPNVPYLCLHAKSMVVDELVSFVGSYNLDPRSENINTEVGLVVRDRTFADLLKGFIVADMQPRNSWVVARKDRPIGIEQTNALLVEISHLVPLVDIWPFRYTASFELIEGREGVDADHPDFYKNYRDVGSFPQINMDSYGKELGARGTKAFLSFVKPLL